jgi:hypothetical protein
MERYLLFAYDDYYPNGGWNDFQGSFDSVQDALDSALETDCERYEVVHKATQVIVIEGKMSAGRWFWLPEKYEGPFETEAEARDPTGLPEGAEIVRIWPGFSGGFTRTVKTERLLYEGGQ